MSENNGTATKKAPAKKSAAKAKAVKKAAPANAEANPTGPAPVKLTKLGAPELKTLSLAKLSFPASLQHREKLVDGATVDEYAVLMGEGVKFPPIDVVDDGEQFYVFDGFQRGAAYLKAGVDKVPCAVLKGTYTDAFLLSLKSNSANSILPRTGEDKMRAIHALIDTPDVFGAVAARVKPGESLHRVIATVTGSSLGWVDEALARRNLSVKGDKLVPRKPKPEPAKEQKPAATAPATTGGAVDPVKVEPEAVTPEQQRAATAAAYAVVKAQAYRDRVGEAAKLVKRLGMIVSTLITDPDHGEEVRKMMSAYKVAVGDEFDVKAKAEGNAFQPYYEILEHWPVTSALGAAFNLLKRRAEGEKTEGV